MGYGKIDMGVHDSLVRTRAFDGGWEDFIDGVDFQVAYGVKVMLSMQEKELRKTGKYFSNSSIKNIIKKCGELREVTSVWFEWDADRKCKVYLIKADGCEVEVCVKGRKGGSSWVHSYCMLNNLEIARRKIESEYKGKLTKFDYTWVFEDALAHLNRRIARKAGVDDTDVTEVFKAVCKRNFAEYINEYEDVYECDMSEVIVKEFKEERMRYAEFEAVDSKGVKRKHRILVRY